MSKFSEEQVPAAARELIYLMLNKSPTWSCSVETTKQGFVVLVSDMRLGNTLYQNVLFKAAVDFLLEHGMVAPYCLAGKDFCQITFKGLTQAETWLIPALEPDEQTDTERQCNTPAQGQAQPKATHAV